MSRHTHSRADQHAQALARARTLRRFVLICLLAVSLAVIWMRYGAHQKVLQVLDPAAVTVVRTTGGMLEVASLDKVEEFGWQATYNCPLIDCAELLGSTTSQVRVRARYVYRIALASEWTLERNADHYALTVPPLEPSIPVAFDTATMQLRTEKGSWLSPAAGPNREAVMRQLGPELAVRAMQAPYQAMVSKQAGETVAEFARKWMKEQNLQPDLPIQVSFGDAPPVGTDHGL
ncbi:MAG TPA: hypothetical protein VLJ86_16590 [Ramlibacter sp.]|nr:hypothetical protein [Ramlibacter sp.]